ncbi:MAG: PadR family transcriptional regulator [Terracidiphilus sp.]
MARRSSSSQEVLLGLLTVEPMSGYDLGQSIRASIGFFWNESYGQIYPNLKKLAAADLVTAKTEKQKGKPDRQVYSITPRGRAHLEKWLAVEPQPEVPRNELLLKLFFGVQGGAETVIGYVERMAKRQSAYLEKFRQVEREMMPQMDRYPDVPYWRMAARYGQLQLEAHLRWAEETLTTLRKMEASRRRRAIRKEKRNASKLHVRRQTS